jgi:hypothetical protein
MSFKKLAASLGVVFLLGAGLSVNAFAADVSLNPQLADSQVNFGGDITVPAGQTREGDVVAFGGNVVVDGTVTNSVVALGGNVTVNGSVGHDVSAVGGDVTLGPHASVGRDVTLAGGVLHRDPTASVGGQVVYAKRSNINFGGLPATALSGWRGFPLFNWFGFSFGITVAIGFILLGLLLLVFFPRQLQTAGATLERRPLESFGLGCGGFLAGVALSVLFAITLILIPVSFALLTVMTVGWLFGWAALFLLTGERLLRTANRPPELVLALLVGGVILGLLANVPLLNWLVLPIGGSLALGATIYSRFGTRPPELPLTGPAAPVTPPASNPV